MRSSLLALIAAEVISSLGSLMTLVALPWFVLTTTGSPGQMGVVLAAEARFVQTSLELHREKSEFSTRISSSGRDRAKPRPRDAAYGVEVSGGKLPDLGVFAQNQVRSTAVAHAETAQSVGPASR